MEWRPIETAPKDGAKFWAFERGAEVKQYECFWQDDPEWGGWQTAWDDEPEPTHWMPLPAPPKDTAWIDQAATHDFNDES